MYVYVCDYIFFEYFVVNEGREDGIRDEREISCVKTVKCCSHCGINNKAKKTYATIQEKKKKSFTCWQNNNKPTTNVYVGDCTKYKYFSAHGTRLSNINVST